MFNRDSHLPQSGFFYLETRRVDGNRPDKWSIIHLFNSNKESSGCRFGRNEFVIGYVYCLTDIGYVELSHDEYKSFREGDKNV